MKIWFDGQCFQTASRNRGIGRYCAELVAALRKANPDIEMCVSFNAALADLALADGADEGGRTTGRESNSEPAEHIVPV